VWEYTVKRAGLLPKPIYLRFTDEAEGDLYCRNLEALLDKGIIPTEHQVQGGVRTIQELVREYERDAHPSSKDVGAFGPIIKQHGKIPLASITAPWVDGWVSEMKRIENLAPATIRARVGALARATDWGMRKGYLTMPDHPLRTLPDGYAQYTKLDTDLAGVERVDVERDRRLEDGEFEKVMAVLQAGVLPRKQRPLTLEHVPALKLLFVLALESAMRLREMYTLTLDQVDLKRRTVFLDRTKNGDKRQVPMSTVAVAAVKEYLTVRPAHVDGREDDALFPWWDGQLERRGLVKLSDYLSKLFGSIFDAAQCEDLRFHDLRHEATSRLFERTQLSEAKIMKITGHKSHRMMMRYANLRGSDLADELW
jgi:integrase